MTWGRPDIALVRQGQLPRAFIELKAPDKHLDPHGGGCRTARAQPSRFGELPVRPLSNFGGAPVPLQRGRAGGPQHCPACRARSHYFRCQGRCSNRSSRRRSVPRKIPTVRLLKLIPWPSPSNAEQLKILSRMLPDWSARTLLKSSASSMPAKKQPDHCSWFAMSSATCFTPTRVSGGYRGEFNTLFSAAFAQTLAFGLLLVREATNQPVNRDAWRHMPDEHPLDEDGSTGPQRRRDCRTDQPRFRYHVRYRQRLRSAAPSLAATALSRAPTMYG